MSDAYRDEHEAALMQVAALRRENDELRERLGRFEYVLGVRALRAVRVEEQISPSVIAVMLVSLFFFTSALVYAGSVVGLESLRTGGAPVRCAGSTGLSADDIVFPDGAAEARAPLAAPSPDADDRGAVAAAPADLAHCLH